MSGQVLARLRRPRVAGRRRRRRAPRERRAGAPDARDAHDGAAHHARPQRHAAPSPACASARRAPTARLDPDDERMALRLIEIGFVQGAHAARDRVRPAGRRSDRRARGRPRRRQHLRAAARGGGAACGCWPRRRQPCSAQHEVRVTHTPPQIALLGNPNCGKTALFNLLTGSRQKVANYAGVTVERKEGLLHAAVGPPGARARPAGRLQPERAPAPTKPSRATSSPASAPARRRPTCWSASPTPPTCA